MNKEEVIKKLIPESNINNKFTEFTEFIPSHIVFDLINSIDEGLLFSHISKNQYPKPSSILIPDAVKYLIHTKYGYSIAMYLINEKEECSFYSSYQSKIIESVDKWLLLK